MFQVRVSSAAWSSLHRHVWSQDPLAGLQVRFAATKTKLTVTFGKAAEPAIDKKRLHITKDLKLMLLFWLQDKQAQIKVSLQLELSHQAGCRWRSACTQPVASTADEGIRHFYCSSSRSQIIAALFCHQ